MLIADDFFYAVIRDVKDPFKKNDADAGFDVYTPAFDSSFMKDFEELQEKIGSAARIVNGRIYVFAHGGVLIPSGLYLEFPENQMLITCNRSGVASKLQLIYGAHVVDTPYQGEYLINLINTTNHVVTIEPNERIVQLVRVPVILGLPKKIDKAEIHVNKTERGTGGFNSTGRK
jgi:dUTP pyrophosphatase